MVYFSQPLHSFALDQITKDHRQAKVTVDQITNFYHPAIILIILVLLQDLFIILITELKILVVK